MMREHNLEIVRARSLYLPNKRVWCHAGGFKDTEPLHENYGLPCVRGFVYWEDGSQTFNDACIFCGRMDS